MSAFEKQKVPQELKQLGITTRNDVLQRDNFHISYLNNSSDYDVPETTALVFANQLLFFVLGGDHRKEYLARQDSFKDCLDYFLNHLDETSVFSDHLYSIDTAEENIFNNKKTCKDFMGRELYEYFCTRIKEHINVHDDQSHN